MVAQRNEARTQDDLSVGEVDLEVEVGTGSRVRSYLVFPPVAESLGRGTMVQGRVVQPVGDDGPYEMISAELDRLLDRYTEFQDSKVFLKRVSGLALTCGRPQQAFEFANQAIELDHRDLASKYRRTEALLEMEGMEAASADFSELGDAGHVESCLRMVELMIRRDDLEAARGWLASAETIDRFDWRVQIMAGTLDLISGEFERAIRRFRNSVELKPRWVRLHYDLALAHVFAGNAKHAMKALRKAVGLGPLEKRALLAWSDLCDHLRDGIPDVTRAVSRYLDFVPEDRAVSHRFASLLKNQGDTRKARRVLGAMRRSADDARVSNNLGVLAAEQNELRTAVAEFSRSISIASVVDQNAKGVWVVATANLVAALNKVGSPSRAVRVARTFMNVIPRAQLLSSYPEYTIAEGFVDGLMSVGRLGEGAEQAEHWLAADGIHTSLEVGLLERLVCYYTLEVEDYERAYRYAVRGYDVQKTIVPPDLPTRHVALNNMAVTAIEMGRHEEASEFLARMQPMAGANGAFWYATRGLLAMRTGNLEKGQALYGAAVAMANADIKTQLRKKLEWETANYWLRRGRRNRAKSHLRKVAKAKVRGTWKLGYLDGKARQLLRLR